MRRAEIFTPHYFTFLFNTLKITLIITHTDKHIYASELREQLRPDIGIRSRVRNITDIITPEIPVNIMRALPSDLASLNAAAVDNPAPYCPPKNEEW